MGIMVYSLLWYFCRIYNINRTYTLLNDSRKLLSSRVWKQSLRNLSRLWNGAVNFTGRERPSVADRFAGAVRLQSHHGT